MAAIASKARGGLPRNLALAFITAVMVANMFVIFMFAPTEAVSGHVQRIMYMHVPMAWLAFLAFFVVFFGSVMYLWKRREKWDALASSAAELGIIFTSLVLITGPIWAKPVWGVWWTWDPRLTATLVLWLIYVGYLMLRAYSANRSQGATFSAVLGIVGFIDVPIVYFAVDWWRTQHQRLVIGGTSMEGDLHPDMALALLFSVIAFTLLFVVLLRQRVSLKRVERGIREMKEDAEFQAEG